MPSEHNRHAPPLPEERLLNAALADGAAMSLMRCRAASLCPGLDLSRCDDHEVLALLRSRHFVRRDAAPGLPSMGQSTVAAASAPRPAGRGPVAAVVAAAPAPPEAAAETTFAPDLDVESMVAALRNASAAGVPFCEECARAAARQALAA